MHDLQQPHSVRTDGSQTLADNVLEQVRQDQVQLVPTQPSQKFVSKEVLADREYMKGDRSIDYAQGHGY